MGLEDEINLFLVTGHSKNICHGSFGHIKRRLLNEDAVTPADMMKIVRES